MRKELRKKRVKSLSNLASRLSVGRRCGVGIDIDYRKLSAGWQYADVVSVSGDGGETRR